VRFAVHPLAGRLPGQVHAALLAAGVPAGWCLDADLTDFDDVDLCVVLGAHDLLHPALWGPRRSPLLTARARVLLQDPGRPGYAELPLPPGAAARARRMTGDLTDGLGMVAALLGGR
jgi:NAD(P) transhydrogenase subunit beta